MSESSERSEAVQSLLETVAGETEGASPDLIAQNLELSMGFDVDSLSDSDAEAFEEAWVEEDVDSMCAIAKTNGVPDDKIRQFREMVGGGEGGNGSPEPDSAGDDGTSQGGVSKAEVGRMIDERADEIAEKTADRLAAKLQGASAGGDEQGGGGGGMNAQTQMALQLASQYLAPESSGLSQKVQEHAMNQFMRKAFSPQPHEIMGQAMALRQYQQMADEMGFDMDESYFEESMKNMFDFGVTDDGGGDGED